MPAARAVGTIQVDVFVIDTAGVPIFHARLEGGALVAPDSAAEVEILGFKSAYSSCQSASLGFFFSEVEVGSVVDVRRARAVFELGAEVV